VKPAAALASPPLVTTRPAAAVAMLPGMPFYAGHSYRAGPTERYILGGLAVKFVPATKCMLQKGDDHK